MKMASQQLLEELAKPFNENEHNWRVLTVAIDNQNNNYVALVAPYIQSRKVMDRLDNVCGAFWKTEYQQIEVDGQIAFQCSISIFIEDQWITRTDGAEASDYETIKGGYSGALKRAGVQWGIGRYLYDIPKYWVNIKQRREHNSDVRVHGKFKVKGQPTGVTGFFEPPKLDLFHQPSSHPQQTIERKADEVTTSQPEKAIQISDEKLKNAMNFVNEQFNFFRMPQNHIARIFYKISNNPNEYSIKTASYDTLVRAYQTLHPVSNYLQQAFSYGLSEREALEFAHKKLGVPIKTPEHLVFNMDKQLGQEILNLIKRERNIA